MITSVKDIKESGKFITPPEKVTCSYKGENAKRGAEVFASFTDAEIVSDGFVEFVFDPTLEDRDEIYAVKSTSDKIVVCFRDIRGAVNGAATVALLLRKQ